MSRRAREEKSKKRPAEKPVSLHPLEFEEALGALLEAEPEDTQAAEKKKTKKSRRHTER